MAPAPSTVARAPLMNRATTGFLHLEMRSSRPGSTWSPMRRAMRAMYFVSGSASSASMPMSIISPPTSFFRSFPPVPMVWDTPVPASWRMAATCWMPTPEAPQMPKGPRLLMLASTSAAPLMLATPQSGPIHSRPFSQASSFISRSSDRGTLLLNTTQCSPAFSAFFTSPRAYSPGTAMEQRFALGQPSAAALMVG